MLSEEEIYKAIRSNIVKLREKHPVTEKKVTQKALADAIGIERSTLTNILLGNQRPPIYVIYRICDFFSVPLDMVLPKIDDISGPKPGQEMLGPDGIKLPPRISSVVNDLKASKKR